MTFIKAELKATEASHNNDNNHKTTNVTSKLSIPKANLESRQEIFIKTPLIESVILKQYAANRPVYLKMENCQPSGSFKLRGLSNLCQYAKSHGYERFVCPSGGNAGMATAYSARKLGMPCHIVVNKQTPESTRETIAAFGASVEIYGNSVNESVVRAKQLTEEDPKLFLVHPFDHKAIWDGHSSMIDEIAEELGQEPSIIVTCCGGGGLTNGLVRGCRRHNWETTKILSMEAIGCHSFNISLQNNCKRTRMENMSSRVVCLSVDEVCQEILDEYQKAEPPILSRLVEERDAAKACLKFADDHRVLVGLACGTCLAALYVGIIERMLTGTEDPKEKELDKVKLDLNGNRIDEYDNGGPIVVIVCGGAEISMKQMDFYRKLWNFDD